MSDLETELPRPAATSGAVPAQRRAALPTAPLRVRTTPALELRVTPLRWRRPSLALDGGLRLRVGPLQLGLAQR